MTKRPSLLYVITRLAMGGAPQSVLTAVRGLRSLGYKVTLASGYPDVDEGSLVDAAQQTGATLHFVPMLQRAVDPIRDFQAFLHLRRLIRQGSFDVVHTHLSKAGILGRLAARGTSAKVVHTYHGDVLDGYFSSWKSRVFMSAERFAGRFTDRFVCVSNPLRQRLVEYDLGEEKAFCVIANGIDLDVFARTDQSEQAASRVGTLAMFYPIKRLDLFVDMAAQLRNKRTDVSCVIAGDGMEAPTLKKQSQALGKPVDFMGVCNDPAGFLASLDVFVLCSDFEGAGLSLMEAMAAGVPVVATRVGGVVDIVQDGETGLLVPPGDAGALHEAVDRLLQDAALRKHMGRAARQYAKHHFAAADMVAQLDRLYCEVLS